MVIFHSYVSLPEGRYRAGKPYSYCLTFRAGGAAGINQDNFNGLHRNWFTVNGNCFRIPHRPVETLFETLVQ